MAVKKQGQEIQGQVTSVLNGNTFKLQLGEDSARELKMLEQIVTVTIAQSHHMETNTLGGVLAKLELEKRLVGQRVSCEIVARTRSRGFVANINLDKLRTGFSLYD